MNKHKVDSKPVTQRQLKQFWLDQLNNLGKFLSEENRYKVQDLSKKELS